MIDFKRSNIRSGKYISVSSSGSNSISGSGSNTGLLYTNNYGKKWYQSNITDGNFNTVFLVGTIGIAGSGSNKGIYYTTNSGETWQQSNITDGYFNKVSLSGTYGSACSASNLGIFYTINSGETWTSSNLDTANFNTLSLSEENGIAAAEFGIIYYTNNYGETWTASNLNNIATYPDSMVLSGANGVISAGGEKGIWYSNDYGQTWQSSSYNNGTVPSVALSGTIGIAGASSLLYTNDYGVTWTPANIVKLGVFTLALSETIGLANLSDPTGQRGGIYSSIDSCQTWTQSNINYTDIFALSCLTETNVIACSTYLGQGIFYTANPPLQPPIITDFYIETRVFGVLPFTITPPKSDSSGAFTYTSSDESVATINGDVITVVGVGSSLIRAFQEATEDYAPGEISTTFEVNSSNPLPFGFKKSNITSGKYFSISSVESNAISGSGSNRGLYYTNNYGKTWYQSNITDGNFNTVFLQGTSGIAGSGSNTGLLYTTNSGETWQQSNITDSYFNKISLSGIYGSACSGSNLGMYYTEDSGVTWKSSNLNTGNFNTVSLSGENGITGSEFGTIYYTEDSGKTWTSTGVINIGTYTDSMVLSGAHGIIGRDYNGGILYSNDSGKTWQSTNVTTGWYTSVSLSGTNALANGLYSFNSGKTWSNSNIFQRYGINSVVLSGTSGLTNPSDPFNSGKGGVYSSNDNGQTWIQSNLTNDIFTMCFSGIYPIAASNYLNTGIYYTFGTEAPTITDFYIPEKTYGDLPFKITPPKSDSPGTFSYTSSDTLVATISGDIITIVGAGTSTIIATQEAVIGFTSGSISTPFLVNKANPTIIGFSIPEKTYGDSDFTITPPISNSSSPFTYSSSNLLVATINSTTGLVTIVGAGTTQIIATQEATPNFNSGTTYTPFKVNKATPMISDFTIPEKTYGDAAFTITPPISDSPGSFIYTSSDNSVATIFGNTIIIIGAGSSTIIAIQLETQNYTSGTIPAIFQVNKADPIISDFTIPEKTYGDPDFTITPPISTSPGSFIYTSSDDLVATISENIVTITGAGTVEITATQQETNNYNSGTTHTPFKVNKAVPTITNFIIPEKTIGGDIPVIPFTITAPTSDSPGLFIYTSSDTSVAEITENTITIIAAGTSIITAIQQETNNYISGTITTEFIVIQLINSPEGLKNFMDTPAPYGIITDSLELNEDLSSSSSKSLFVTNNDTKITINTGGYYGGY